MNLQSTSPRSLSLQYSIKELSILIDTHLIPDPSTKIKHGEVSTPYKLRQDMLDKVPIEFWKQKRKVFESCCGKGGFIIDIINRFMDGLTIVEADEDERYRLIVEECLYFSDINPDNIAVCKALVDPHDKYKLNFNQGNTLLLNIQEKWGIPSFDAVISNPPYNRPNCINNGNTIWQEFTRTALESWINPNGFLVFVHPAGWRKPTTKKSVTKGMFELMTKSNHMLYLSIHSKKEGIATFKCEVKYDWYVIQKKRPTDIDTTLIRFENGDIRYMFLPSLDFLPNSLLPEFEKVMAGSGDEVCPVIYNAEYNTRKEDKLSSVETPEFKYPCIHSTPLKGVRYVYTNDNTKGLFGIPKVVFGVCTPFNVIIDIDGRYGATNMSMGIKIDSYEEGLHIQQAMSSRAFKTFIKSCIWGNFAMDWVLFSYFKKDFWKEFI